MPIDDFAEGPADLIRLKARRADPPQPRPKAWVKEAPSSRSGSPEGAYQPSYPEPYVWDSSTPRDRPFRAPRGGRGGRVDPGRCPGLRWTGPSGLLEPASVRTRRSHCGMKLPRDLSRPGLVKVLCRPGYKTIPQTGAHAPTTRRVLVVADHARAAKPAPTRAKGPKRGPCATSAAWGASVKGVSRSPRQSSTGRCRMKHAEISQGRP